MKIKLWQLRALVKEKYSLIKALYKVNPDGKYVIGQTCFCPFHDNENTPAAALYDNEGSESMYCFSEKKLYTVLDALETLLHYDVYELGQKLWVSMSEAEQQSFLLLHQDTTDYGNAFSVKSEEKPEINRELEKAKLLYKSHKLSVNKLLAEYIR
jgi:hypothetical protein